MDPDGPGDGATEAEIGLFAYATRTPGLGGRLKTRVDDFEVEEVGPRPAEDPRGRFVAARLRLTNWETNAFVRESSARLGVSRKKVHYSGAKDKRGVTERWFTFEAPPESVRELGRLSGVEVLDVVRTSTELDLGMHHGNRFRVVLRNVPRPVGETQAVVRATWDELRQLGGAPNTFGPQRFGSRRATTHRVGERILRGDFEGAIRAYLGTPPGLGEAAAAAWRPALDARDWRSALAGLQGGQGFERALLHRLIETDGDSVAALGALPAPLQRLFVHATQSFLFNRIVGLRLQAGLAPNRPALGDLAAPVEDGTVEATWVPVTQANLERVAAEAARGRAVLTGLLPGTEAPFAGGEMGRIERQVLAEAHLQPRDFVVPERLEWSSKGTRRALAASVRDFGFEAAPDDLHPGASLVRFAFELPAGAYATAVLREFMKSPRLLDYG